MRITKNQQNIYKSNLTFRETEMVCGVIITTFSTNRFSNIAVDYLKLHSMSTWINKNINEYYQLDVKGNIYILQQ